MAAHAHARSRRILDRLYITSLGISEQTPQVHCARAYVLYMLYVAPKQTSLSLSLRLACGVAYNIMTM